MVLLNAKPVLADVTFYASFLFKLLFEQERSIKAFDYLKLK